MPSGDLFRVQAFFSIGSELTECVWHFKETTSSTDAVPARSLAHAIAAVIGPLYGVLSISNEARLSVMHVRRILPATGIPATVVFGTVADPEIVGIGASGPVPSQSAVLVSLYTDDTTRNGIGRYYLPGLNATSQNDGQLFAAALTDMQELADGLKAPLTAVGPEIGVWKQHVFSRMLNSSSPVTVAIANSNMATIKGRRAFPGVV